MHRTLSLNMLQVFLTWQTLVQSRFDQVFASQIVCEEFYISSNRLCCAARQQRASILIAPHRPIVRFEV